MNGIEVRKRRAAERAVGFVQDGMRLGLGTGSTARLFLDALARRREDGGLDGIACVPTSRGTERRARELGLPLTSLDAEPRLDLTVDGADEVDPALRLIKGMGGALLWEKIVATASARMVVIVDRAKLVERLGLQSPLPVEVVPFGWSTHLPVIEEMGAEPVLRLREDGEPVLTDGGHLLLDCRFREGIHDPGAVERVLRTRPGVVDTGLFLDQAWVVVVGDDDDTEVLERPTGRATSDAPRSGP